MIISRRQFLTYCTASAALLGLDWSGLKTLEKALAASNGPTVVWLSGTACTGCTVSLANRFAAVDPVTDVGDLLINYINLAYHSTLMGAAGDQAVASLKTATAGKFILAVEGGIPTAFGGNTCTVYYDRGKAVTALSAVQSLASRSLANLAIGTCASFGGMAAAKPNPTGVKSLAAATGKPVINIPGCPTHPDWVVGSIALLLSGQAPALDAYGRPAVFFDGAGHNVHEQCPRNGMTEVASFGQVGCLKGLGCHGPETQADCPSRQWNHNTNWCVGANSVCLGCTEKGFPDAFSPFYKR
ncbi:MAG: hydrogenase small subunit [Deltaproteobacteria bacterium]|nr:hydrogenase small subunit [Deltaproteobacteria bacterium]